MTNKVGDLVTLTRKQSIDHFAAIDCGPNGTITEIIPDYWKGSAWAKSGIHYNLTGYRISMDDLVARHGAALFSGNVYHHDEFKRRK